MEIADDNDPYSSKIKFLLKVHLLAQGFKI